MPKMSDFSNATVFISEKERNVISIHVHKREVFDAIPGTLEIKLGSLEKYFEEPGEIRVKFIFWTMSLDEFLDAITETVH